MDNKELYNTYATSEYGQSMEQKTRFDVFKPEWATTELWCDILGDDVNNLRHMAYTARIAEYFAQGEDLSTDQTNLLLRTASTHDWGEAVIGDIPLPDKTGADERAERRAYATIARDLIGNPDSMRLTSEVWSVLSHEDEDAGDQFKTIEYIGYCTTALKAGKMAVLMSQDISTYNISRVQKDQLVSGLSGLNRAVEVGNFKTLSEMSRRYKSVREIMEEL